MSDNRFSLHYQGSKQRRKVVVTQLAPTGNGYLCVAYLPEYDSQRDSRGWINIKELNHDQLVELVSRVIRSMS